jgi:hypothetical protein
MESIIDPAKSSSDLFNDLKRCLFEEKVIDQKFLYWNVDSSRLWVNICEHSTYPLYNRSISLLTNNFGNEIIPLLKSIGFESPSFVNIGVGSGLKDFIILKNLLNHYSSVYYFPIDISYPMIQETIKHVIPLIESYPTKLFSKAILGNIESLKRYQKIIRPNNSVGVVYGFLGSNISNFRENTILDIFHANMTKDDILLMEVDLLGYRSDENILEGYSDIDNKNFIWQPLSFLGIVKPDDWEDRFDFTLEFKNTDIPLAKTVVSKYISDDGPITLSTSTKYHKQKFLEHIVNYFGFKILKELSQDDNYILLVMSK